MLDSENEPGLLIARRVPADLSRRIAERAATIRRADDRRDRFKAATVADELLTGVRSEWAKQSANAARATKPATVGQ